MNMAVHVLQVVLLLCAGLGRPAAVAGAGLRDEPVTAPVTQLLDTPADDDGGGGSGWTATAADPLVLSRPVPSQVPGDLVTDLEVAGAIADPLYELNFKSTLWDQCNWTVAAAFTVDTAEARSRTGGGMGAVDTVMLVLDGVKMGAWVYLNDHYLGAVADQFLRYRYTVTDVVNKQDGSSTSNTTTTSTNVLKLVFPPSNHTLNTEARSVPVPLLWVWVYACAPHKHVVNVPPTPHCTYAWCSAAHIG